VWWWQQTSNLSNSSESNPRGFLELNKKYKNKNKIFEHVTSFFKENINLSKYDAEQLSIKLLQEILPIQLKESVLGSVITMPPINRIKELAGITKSISCNRPDDSIMTITVKPAKADPGTPKITELPGVAQAKELMAKAFGIYNNLDQNSQEIFKDCLINKIMGNKVDNNIIETSLLELERSKNKLSLEDRKKLAKMLNHYWRMLALDIDQWKDKTDELENVELAILLLRKVSDKILKGE